MKNLSIMQIQTTSNFNLTGLNKKTQNTQSVEQLPKNCVPFSQFKKEYFRRLKERYEKIQVDHS